MAKKKLKEGTKFDEGKPRFDLIPAYPLEQLAKVYTFGIKKYEENNWRKGMKWSRTFSAIMRHCWAFWSGETYDKESGLHHMAHAAFGLFCIIEYGITQKRYDDRPIRYYRIREVKSK